MSGGSLGEKRERIKSLIRDARIEEALVLFNEALSMRRERKHLRPLANVAWRLERPETAISILHRFVRPGGRARAEADRFEKMEYGVALIRSGAWEEGRELLESVMPDDFPEVLLFRALYHVQQFDHASAAPVLEELVAHPGLGPSGLLNAKVFLASTLNHCNREPGRVDSLLDEVLEGSSPGHYGYHYRNAQLIKAQVALYRRDAGQARFWLDRLQETIAGESSVFGALLAQWRAVLALLEAGDGEARSVAIGELNKIKARLRGTSSEWRIRSCDYFVVKFLGDEEIFRKLYFGTNSEVYRERLRRQWPEFGIPPKYDLVIRREDAMGDPAWISAIDGANSRSKGKLSDGSAPLRLFQALCSDFYRSFRLIELHEALYPGEYYNPHSSPARVQQVVARLKRWFEECGLPLTVEGEGGFYRFRALGSVRIEIPAPEEREAVFQAPTRPAVFSYLLKAREMFGDREFTMKEFSEMLGISSRSAVRHLKEAGEVCLVHKLGKGRSTRYRLSADLLNAESASPAAASDSSASA